MEDYFFSTEEQSGKEKKAYVLIIYDIVDNSRRTKLAKFLQGYGFRVQKSEFVERFPELSLFYRLFSPLDSEMICIFPYFCPCEIIVREIREILF